jgi:hypothetical protein|nr:MAG TPA: hypothetical protein [Caudoviricetes sp.]
MGGRGASSGISVSGKPYGSEFRALLKAGNIKFVKAVDGAQKTPMETMTKGRVYVTLNKNDNIKAITYYDAANKRTKQIDLDRPHNKVSPHTHHGYIHSENDSAKGYANLTTEEKKMVERVKKIWYNRRSK